MRWPWTKKDAELARPGALAAPVAFLLNLFGLRPSVSGEAVSTDSAMRVPAMRNGVNLIAGAIASLPRRVVRTDFDGTVTELKPGDHRAAAILARPNSFTRPVHFFRDLITDFLLQGDGLSIVTKVSGEPRELIRVCRPGVVVERDRISMAPIYRVALVNGQSRVYGAGDILHLRDGFCADGLHGRGALHDGADAIGLAIAQEKAAGQMHANGHRPSGVLIMKPAPGEQAGATLKLVEKIKELWKTANSGENEHGTVLLPGDIDWKPLSMTSADAEFMAARRWQVSEIGRLLGGVSPVLLGDLEKASLNNAEAMAQQLLSFVLIPIVEMLEEELERVLIPAEEWDSISIEFDTSDFARADTEKRTNALKAEVETGLATLNEGRRKLGRSPVPGGDEARISVQSQPTQPSAPAKPNPKKEDAE